MASSSVSDLRIVLIGKNESENIQVENFIKSRTAAVSDSGASSHVQQTRFIGQERNIRVFNMSNLLQTNLTQTVSQCAPDPHVFILVLQYNDFHKQDKQRVGHILSLFSQKAIKHTIVLTTDEEPITSMFTAMIRNNAIHNLIKECGGRHIQFDIRNQRWYFEMLRCTEKILKEKDEEFVICDVYKEGGGGTSVDGDLSRSGFSFSKEEMISYHRGDGKLNESTTRGSDGGGHVKLKLVLFGNERSKSSISELILSESRRGSVVSSEFMRRDVELHGRQISLMEFPALINLSEEEVMRQTLRCVSLCHPGVHLFILIIPEEAPLNNEDKAEVEKMQQIFSSIINKHMMILIQQDSELHTAELSEETQTVIQRFGGRHYFINRNTQVSALMKKIEQMLEENRGEVFSTETFLELQMEKLLKYDEMKRRIHSMEMWFQSQGPSKRADEVRIVLLGKTGVGKSATGNTILGREAFKSSISLKSITKECQKQTTEINGRSITVIDTPGLFDTQLSNEETKTEISNCISMILPGPHVFLLLISLGRFTQEEQESVKIIQENFGENSLKYTMVLFTRGDDLRNKTIEECLEEADSALKNLIETCGNRVHVFNNNQTEDRTQVSDLLMKIEKMVKTNGDSYYSCRMFREMEREIQEKQKRILEEKMKQLKREREELMKKHEEDKRRQMHNHDREIKRREEEFSQREARYKRDIKEREEKETKMQEEMKREREQRDEEDERRRKKEWEMRNEFKKVKKRMKMMVEEERQIRDKERKRREEEFREEQYKKDIKDIEDRKKSIEEEMKRERAEWERQKQVEKETQNFNQLTEKTPEVKHTKSQPQLQSDDSASKPECLRILLFGRTGSGKSATGNTILGKEEFRSEASTDSVTRVCQKGAGEAEGRSVCVVDTPELFDLKMSKEQVQEQILKCVSLSAPGPHVFIIVVSLRKILKYERDTLDMITMMFGPEAAKFCIVLFTKADTLKNQTITQYVEQSKNAELRNLISDCGNRFLAFNNAETQDQTQVTRLFNMIEEVKKSNQGRYFTNEVFQEAEVSKRGEMIRENERQTQTELKESEARYEMELRKMRERVEEKKRKTDEERERMENKIRERAERLMREFEEKEKSDLEKREEEDQKQADLEKQMTEEYNLRIEEIEDQRKLYEKQQEDNEEDRKKEEYEQDLEQMKNELLLKQDNKFKMRDSEEQMRKEEEDKEREEWMRKIKEAGSDEREIVEQQHREWEEEKKQQMREREKEERDRKEKHEKQLRETEEELEKLRKKSEREREDIQMKEEKSEGQRQQRKEKERQLEEKKCEMKRQHEQLLEERKEEWKRRKQEDEERREEKRRRWRNMIDDLKRDQEEEIKRRGKEEREIIEKEEEECDEMIQRHKEEIEKMRKKHQDEARKQQTELRVFTQRVNQQVQKLNDMITLIYAEESAKWSKWSCHVM